MGGSKAEHTNLKSALALDLLSYPPFAMFPSLPVQAVRTSFSTQPFKRQQLGLMHGAVKQYGNNVPHSMNKTRRYWLPNIQTKRLFSRTLNEWIKVDLTARALRCIDKVRSHSIGFLQAA